jgi:hypothetical protein
VRVSNGGYSRRTFPDSAPGTDGVAIFEGRVIDRVQHMTNLPGDPKWSWSVTDPELGVTLAADDRKPARKKERSG